MRLSVTTNPYNKDDVMIGAVGAAIAMMDFSYKPSNRSFGAPRITKLPELNPSAHAHEVVARFLNVGVDVFCFTELDSDFYNGMYAIKCVLQKDGHIFSEWIMMPTEHGDTPACLDALLDSMAEKWLAYFESETNE